MAEKEIDPFDLATAAPEIAGDLRPAPKFADRISKRVLGVVFVTFVVVFAVFMFALNNMDQKKKAPPESTSEKEAKAAATGPAAGAPDDIKGADTNIGVKTDGGAKADGGSSLVKDKPPAADVTTGTTIPKVAGAGAGTGTKGNGGVPAIGAMGEIPAQAQPAYHPPPPLTPEQQAANQEKAARMTRMTQARSGGLSAKPFGGDGAANGAGANPALAALLAAAQKGGAAGGFQKVSAQAPASNDEQSQKLDFVKNAEQETPGYHPHVPLPAISKNEIKASSFIPMTLEQNINSDLPGMITARVSENVYDTISGCRLLIPSMSRVLGKYDSKVALGQGRMLVVWNSIIFPNGDELNLAGMQGYDTGGAAGLDSEVDNHYWRLFGLTFGLSLISTGVQMSAPPVEPVPAGATPPPPTAAQVMASALAQQYGQLGAQILGKYMAVQPTLRNYAGERFMMMIPRTIVMPKVWRNRCVGDM